MEFRVLGPLEVRRDGRSLELHGSKRRAVLAIFVMHANEVVRTDRLIDELWGEDPPANASAALHNHVSRLRKDLGDDVLVTKPWGYVLRTNPEGIDVRRFERLVTEAKPLAANERAAKLLEALALWRGPALADLAREPALAVEIARLEELRLAALEQRIDADLELGGHAELVRELEALVAEHPLRERLRGQLILALYRSGRQAEALETYRETRRVLVEELGIDPSPELRELERAILRQDPSLASAPRPHEPVPNEPPRSRWRWPRSPLVAAGFLLLLATGGGATAIIETNGGAPHRLGAVSASPAAAHRSRAASSATKTRAGKTGAQRSRVRRSSSTSKAEPAATTTRETHSGKPAPAQKPRSHRQREYKPPTAQGPTTQANSVGATKPKPKPKPKPAKSLPPAKVYWITDDFEDPAFDFGRWQLGTHGAGMDLAERNGQLEFSIVPEAVTEPGYVDRHYGTQCFLTGNFDARVQFSLLAWPEANGAFAMLGAYYPPPNEAFWHISRQGQPATGGFEGYTSQVGSDDGFVQTADLAGALRVKRQNGILTTYYLLRGAWVRLAAAFAPGPALAILSFSTNADQFGHQAASGAFDNFEATATSVDCQGVPLPPLRARR
jgi:DNA-binding SARP family transcriptional activator